ncbi:(2E)-enoyl-ACP glycyltransferase [Streptomyces sp. NBC_01716]|uniref:(2E)-enoyl-ACP glycyltransferase n=1 Tax=Streptomyces sp. NBC_01716 TaxID=2975917 RepID=UPI002E2FDD2F|nr:FcoT family thioesterase [Streptomyces sp. NBC_01716]
MTSVPSVLRTARPARSYETDHALLARVLLPYKENCAYVRSAEVTTESGRVAAHCEFAIPESCYIKDTGHLNSVEVNICYNQMMYYLVAKSVQERLLEPLSSWTLEDYWTRQLPDILIARFSSNFRRPVNPRSFSGEMEFTAVSPRRPAGGSPLLVAETAFRYRDGDGGRCDGEAVLAFVNLP